MAPGPDAFPAEAEGRGKVPGEIGVWLLIAGDVVLFSVLFVTFLYYRSMQRGLFAGSQAQLDQVLGLVNTLLMLTSSWLVASGVNAVRLKQAAWARNLLAGAATCGGLFVLVKYFEYSAKVRAGFTPVTNDFFMYYFVYTGIHLIHVLIGIGVLLVMRAYMGGRPVDRVKVQHLESGASFWHLVDLLWIMLFALLYLVK